jgi:large subunit ribosomal protein L18
MNRTKKNLQKKLRRKRRVRSRIFGTEKIPRLSLFRSNKYLYAQMINDENRKTIFSISTMREKVSPKSKAAELLGEKIARQAHEKGIQKAIFDRGSYRFHGRVKAFVESARKSGLTI